MTFGLGNRCSILLSYGTADAARSAARNEYQRHPARAIGNAARYRVPEFQGLDFKASISGLGFQETGSAGGGGAVIDFL